ncbi:MAG: alpha/beta hydrolase, partial [Acidobacteria bacterium]|nr:alpha/beta hydrolase [Acidobacteriota bacterium]
RLVQTLYFGKAVPVGRLQKYYSSVLVREPAHEERQRIVHSAYEIAPTLEQAWRSFARPEENVLPNVPKIKCPVFLAWAKHDFVLPLKTLQPSFSRFRHYQLEIFDGGHAAFLEDPEQFELSLRRFLNSMQDSSAAPVAQPGS